MSPVQRRDGADLDDGKFDVWPRWLELILAIALLVLLGPFLLLTALAVKLTSPGPVLYCHRRAGRDGQPFKVFKFRTMVADADQRGAAITHAGDPRITGIGRWLRKSKVDEWPQLFNVIRGEMNIVGPRPEALCYIPHYPPEYRFLLRYKPGITDPSSVAFLDEEAILAAATDREVAYIHEILPQKLALAAAYARNRSLKSDMATIFHTMRAVAVRS